MLQNLEQETAFILFVQHGWADTYRNMDQLARSLAPANTIIYAPDLGWINTWLTIAPLIAQVEKVAMQAIAEYPERPWRIVGHSMGGLIWLEVLDRHPEWLPRIHSFALIGSPLGGSDLARLCDPFGWFPLIARELAKNRRAMAEAIAFRVPTISIVGDIGNHTDGTVAVGCSQFANASFICLDGLHHARLKNDPQVKAALQKFWENPLISAINDDIHSQLIAELRSLDLTEASNQNFPKAKLIRTYANATKLWIWENPWRITHVFVTVGDRCVYSAYTGWQGFQKLAIALRQKP
jgi:pimeloyl-ACP methyl ester carboxylesterase